MFTSATNIAQNEQGQKPVAINRFVTYYLVLNSLLIYTEYDGNINFPFLFRKRGSLLVVKQSEKNHKKEVDFCEGCRYNKSCR